MAILINKSKKFQGGGGTPKKKITTYTAVSKEQPKKAIANTLDNNSVYSTPKQNGSSIPKVSDQGKKDLARMVAKDKAEADAKKKKLSSAINLQTKMTNKGSKQQGGILMRNGGDTTATKVPKAQMGFLSPGILNTIISAVKASRPEFIPKGVTANRIAGIYDGIPVNEFGQKGEPKQFGKSEGSVTAANIDKSNHAYSDAAAGFGKVLGAVIPTKAGKWVQHPNFVAYVNNPKNQAVNYPGHLPIGSMVYDDGVSHPVLRSQYDAVKQYIPYISGGSNEFENTSRYFEGTKDNEWKDVKR